jgi:DNA polymerase
MPNDSFRSDADELLAIARGLKTRVKSGELFGEEEFSVVRSAAPADLPASPPPALERCLAPVPSAPSEGDPAAGLAALCGEYENCRDCRLGDTRKKFVFGVGSPRPRALFIGEGPGFEEDRQGLPFVGKAGQLLDKILAAIGLDRTTVYIANMVKCHPMRDPSNPELRGNDRPPEPEEMAACRKILDRQIQILNPPVICVLGATAAKGLLRTEEGITRLRGRVFQFEIPGTGRKVPLIPTYHPAALLRNEALKKDVWQDMKQLRALLDSRPA